MISRIIVRIFVNVLGPLLLIGINFNPSMDKLFHPLWSVWWNYVSIPKLQRCNRWSLEMDKNFHPSLHCACEYLSMLGFKSNHVSKRDPWYYLFQPNIGNLSRSACWYWPLATMANVSLVILTWVIIGMIQGKHRRHTLACLFLSLHKDICLGQILWNFLQIHATRSQTGQHWFR